MTHYLVLGAGRQGTAVVHDLVVHGGATAVTWVDSDDARLQTSMRRIGRATSFEAIRGRSLDASDRRALMPLFTEAAVCVNALPYRYSLAMTQLALEGGAHYLDLGGNTQIVREQFELHRAHPRGDDVVVLPDCGLMPGLGNLLVALAVDELGQCEKVEVRCGGLPQNPKPPLDYMLVFSVAGLTNEYFGKAEVLRGGRVVQIPTFTELESFDVDGVGRVEAFITSGGLSTTPETFAGKITELDYKTIRYPGHYAKFKVLLELGLLGEDPIRVGKQDVVPRHLLHVLLEKNLAFPGEHDVTVMSMRATSRDGKKRLEADLLDRHDPRTNYSSMERTTAFSATACAAMVARGDVKLGPGPLETAIDPHVFLDELAERGIEVQVRED
ncbi:MAG: saccharopine dehydrogenase C-terminal domain-containing protein [Planctomycetota bacterium]